MKLYLIQFQRGTQKGYGDSEEDTFDGLTSKIETLFKKRWAFMDFGWLVRSDDSAEQIVQFLSIGLLEHDLLFVSELGSNTAWEGFGYESDKLSKLFSRRLSEHQAQPSE